MGPNGAVAPPSHEHRASLTFEYADERRARTVERSVRVEMGEIDDARSRASVDRDGTAVEVHVTAADLVALRAGVNTWTRLVAVAEDVMENASRTRSGDD